MWTARFVGPRIACVGDSFSYTAYDIGTAVQYEWKLTSASAVVTTATGSHQYSSLVNVPGLYAVKLTVTDISVSPNVSRRYTMPDSLEVTQCQPLASTSANWLFGDHAGLHFYQGKVVRSTGPKDNKPNISSYEGSAALSDSAGRLIGYVGGMNVNSAEVNGLRVFGKNYRPMINDTVNGSGSSSQSAVFIPYNSDASKYHLFTKAYTTEINGNKKKVFERYIIDKDVFRIIRGRRQYGELTSRNSPITDTLGNAPGPDEAISAIKRCDDSTYWLTVINPDSSAAEYYVVSDTGVVFSHRIPIFLPATYARTGFVKYSPDGNWVWIANSLYRFCRADGSIELVYNDSLNNNDRHYGICFSPDSRLLYTCGAEYSGFGYLATDSNYQSFLYQYNLTSSDVESSQREVVALDDLEKENYFRAMQLGPDDKIYVSAFNQPYLAVVHSPNTRVTVNNECNFQSVGPVLSVGSDGGISKAGLPNFIDARGPSEGTKGFKVKNVACLSKEFIPSTCCASTYKWYFGTGDSSTAEQPTYSYDSAGYYEVTLIVATDTITQTVKIGLLGGDFTIRGNDILCSSGQYTYEVNENKDFQFTWDIEGGTGLNSAPHQIEVSWGDSGVVKLHVLEESTQCIDSSELKVRKREDVPLAYVYATDNCADYKFTTDYACNEAYSWYFGDGTSSTDQNPIHSFASEGVYTVKLVVGADSVLKTINVGLGSGDLLITGDTVNCDDSTLFAYSVPENANLLYEWLATGTSLFTSVEHEASAVWERSGSMSVIVFNTTNGCTDTNTIAVDKMRPDSIVFTSVITNCTDVQFTTADYCGLDKMWYFGDGDSSALQNTTHEYSKRGSYKVVLCVDGDTVSQVIHLQNFTLPVLEGPATICDPSATYDYNLNNYTSAATYVWSAVNGTVSNPTDSLKAKVQFNSVDSLFNLYLEASNDIGCLDTISIVVEQKPTLVNTISKLAINCYPDSNSYIVGDPPQGGNGTYSYQWYSSLNNSNFTPILNDTGIHHYLLTKLNPKPYFRREVKSGDCESVSNSIQVGPSYLNNEILLTSSDPCHAGDIIEFSGNLVAPNHGISFKWETSTDSLVWSGDSLRAVAVLQSGNPYIYYSDILLNGPMYTRRKIYFIGGQTNAFCPSYSNVIKVSPQVSITQQPQDKLFCEPDASSFVFGISLQDGSTGITTVRAEIRSESGSGYTDLGLVSGNSFTYTPSNPSNYTGVDTFRFRISTSCGVFYSRKAIIATFIKGDIWFRDGSYDDGSEPNEDSTHYEIVRSPDIWNRQMPDNMSAHQNMEFKNNSPNQLNLWVRNRGNEATEPTNLYLYWTLGSINNEEWDIRWLDTTGNQIWNASLGDYFPMGSRINNQNDPIVVPSIPPNGSTKITYDWYPPNPAWFEGLVPDDVRGVSICLLARLEHCEAYPHKMAINEVFDRHVKTNAINNNNIITRNTWVIDEDPNNLVDEDNDGEIDWISGSWTGMGRQRYPSWFTRFCFDELSPSFFSHWNLAVEVDDIVRDAILASSNDNSSITYLGDNIFKLEEGESGVKCISKMVLPENEVFFFRPLFAPVNGWSSLPPEVFEVGMAQYTSDDIVEGAGSFLLDNTTQTLNNIEYVNTQSSSSQESNHLIVSPNPTSSQFNLELDEETKQNLVGETGTIIVADAYGYPHVILTNVSSQDVTNINIGGYKAGMYNVRYEIANQVFYKYVVKTDE
jgi:PKD repeat protein